MELSFAVKAELFSDKYKSFCTPSLQRTQSGLRFLRGTKVCLKCLWQQKLCCYSSLITSDSWAVIPAVLPSCSLVLLLLLLYANIARRKIARRPSAVLYFC